MNICFLKVPYNIFTELKPERMRKQNIGTNREKKKIL